MNSIGCEFRLLRTIGVVQRTFFFLSVEITILGNVIFVLVMTWPLPPFGLCRLETAQSWTYLWLQPFTEVISRNYGPAAEVKQIREGKSFWCKGIATWPSLVAFSNTCHNLHGVVLYIVGEWGPTGQETRAVRPVKHRLQVFFFFFFLVGNFSCWIKRCSDM